MQSNSSDNCVHRYDIVILNLFDKKNVKWAEKVSRLDNISLRVQEKKWL